MAEKKKPRFFYGYVIVAASFFVMTLFTGGLMTFGVFLKPLLSEFGWTRAIVSGAYSLSAVVKGLFGILAGRLTDRFGPRLVLTVCGLAFGIGYLLMSQIGAIWQLYLVYGGLIGFGLSGGWVPLLSTISRWFVKKRNMMIAILLVGLGVGVMIMPPLTRWLISNYAWRTSYMILGVIVLVGITVCAQFLRRDPSQVGILPYGKPEVTTLRLDSETKGLSLKKAWHTKQFWILCAIYFCYGFYLNAIAVHIVPHITDLGISATIAANMLGIIGGIGIAGRIIMGFVTDRIGNKSVLVLNLVLVSAILFWLSVGKEVWTLYLIIGIYGLTYTGVDVVFTPIVAELFGLSSLGVLLGIIGVGFTIGGAMGPFVAGYIFDASGSYQFAFVICALLAIMAAAVTMPLGPTIGQKGRDS